MTYSVSFATLLILSTLNTLTYAEVITSSLTKGQASPQNTQPVTPTGNSLSAKEKRAVRKKLKELAKRNGELVKTIDDLKERTTLLNETLYTTKNYESYFSKYPDAALFQPFAKADCSQCIVIESVQAQNGAAINQCSDVQPSPFTKNDCEIALEGKSHLHGSSFCLSIFETYVNSQEDEKSAINSEYLTSFINVADKKCSDKLKHSIQVLGTVESAEIDAKLIAAETALEKNNEELRTVAIPLLK